ncbi:hypothetical protein [Cohnella sp. AR92]|uniref:hypothetical protein n=1 Tax=Cohnella sp. AR92 TaxID=648716 RepID=UPI000F8CC19D|nr:hypothetical protein [Cohnella sp. AR92]RUS47560.1 hypothetical protein ELR57_07125 [Cohnella sp. AR92]
MKKKVILGFEETASKKRYRAGDEYESKDAKRIKELTDLGLLEGAADDGDDGIGKEGTPNKPE